MFGLRAARETAFVACFAGCVLGAPHASAQSGAGAASAPEPNRVELPVYIGRRVFQEFCARCHGADAEGSSFAPALARSVAGMTGREFEDVLSNGYRGLEGQMPAWGENSEVRRYRGALWAYLTARADGRLPPGDVALAGEKTR